MRNIRERLLIGVSKKVKLILLNLLYELDNEYVYSFFRRIFANSVNSIVLCINNVCNFDCLYCRRDKSRISLCKEEWLDLIFKIRKAGIKNIILVGGSPLLSPWLYELLEKIKAERFSSVYIVTNGSLLTMENIRKLKRYNPVIMVKYGIPSHLYRKITGQSVYSLIDIENNIKRCVKAGFRVMTYSVLKTFNSDRVNEIVSSSLSLGAFPVFERYFTFENHLDLSKPTKDKYFFITQNEFREAISSLEHIFGRYKKAFLASLRATRKSVCGGFDDSLYVDIHGEVYPCIYFAYKDFSLGSVRQEKFIDIYSRWVDKKDKIDYVNYKRETGKKCKGCYFYYFCRGGCPALHKIGIKDPDPCFDKYTFLRKVGYFLSAL